MNGYWPPGPPAIPPTITSPAGAPGAAAIAAGGTLTWPAGDSLTVGQQLVVPDALGATVTFQIGLSTDPPGGNPNILPIVGNHWTPNQVASNAYVVFAFGGCGLDTSSSFSGPTVIITDLTAGAAGNHAITSTITTPGFSFTGMSGGRDAVANGNGLDITLTPGSKGTGGAGGNDGKVHVTRNLLVDGTLTATGGFTGNAATATTAINFSGSLAGDVTGTQGATTLAASGVTASTYGSATSVAVVAVDVKGRVTSASTTAIAIDASQIVSGQLAPASGGTGYNSSASTGVPTINAGTWSTLAQLSVAKGGTGASTAAGALTALGIRYGTVTLVNGTATVTDAATTATTRVLLTATTINAGAGSLTVQYSHVSNSVGASFVVQANIAAGTINTLDTSVLDYMAIQ